MRLFVYTPGFAGEQHLEAVLRANNMDYVLAWADTQGAEGHDRVIVQSRDPIECILEEYSHKGYTQPLSVDLVAQRLEQYELLTQAHTDELYSIRDGYSTRTLYREDYVKPLQWARSIGAELAPQWAIPQFEITIPNAQEIRAYLSK